MQFQNNTKHTRTHERRSNLTVMEPMGKIHSCFSIYFFFFLFLPLPPKDKGEEEEVKKRKHVNRISLKAERTGKFSLSSTHIPFLFFYPGFSFVPRCSPHNPPSVYITSTVSSHYLPFCLSNSSCIDCGHGGSSTPTFHLQHLDPGNRGTEQDTVRG